jgi:predicted 2-oxoglutarate/Fe(II)-dependent dioxygenase YbiX
MSSQNELKFYPTSMPAVGIAVYESVWNNPNKTIADIESIVDDPDSGIKFIGSTVINEHGEQSVKSQGRTSSEIVVSQHEDNEYFKKFNDECENIINACLASYSEEMMISYDTFNVEGFYLLKYNVGEYFGSHYDCHSTNKRSIAVLIYLNDDYEGGELEFVHFNLKIKPKAGTVILFPPNYPYRHVANAVTKGEKYAAVTWYSER